MLKTKIRDVVAECLASKRLCRFYLRYDRNYHYYFPLIQSEKLFLGVEEDDFQLDGFSIRRIKDITKAEMKNDFCEQILEQEGIIDQLVVPDIDLDSWETIFHSLLKRNRNVIVEKENLEEDETQLVIGRIEKIFKKHAYVRHFDADGIWQNEPYKIPYSEIASITFGSRYVEIFSKYLGELPADFGN